MEKIKINAITADVLRRNQPNVIESALRRVEPPAGEGESDEDLVTGEIDNDSTSNSGSDGKNDTCTDGPLPLVVRISDGRYQNF